MQNNEVFSDYKDVDELDQDGSTARDALIWRIFNDGARTIEDDMIGGSDDYND
jgi:hypothetical protein